MKYIDAEQLKCLLDAKYKEFVGKAKIEGYTTLQYQYMADGIDIAEQLIDSLQQEQPEVFDTVAFQKGVQEGRRLEREDALTIADIEKFRREAAKDFTVALVSSGSGLNPKTIAYAIEMADELIKQLKEK